MPKNKGKGGKNRKRGKGGNDMVKRELVLKVEGQEYAQVLRMLGNGRLEALCFDGTRRLGQICGRMRKRVWINQGDIILVGLRDFQDSKCDVTYKYTADEARQLKKMGAIPESAKINETETFEDENNADIGFEFTNEAEDTDEESESEEEEVDVDDL